MEGQPQPLADVPVTVNCTLSTKQKNNKTVYCVDVDTDEVDVAYGDTATIEWKLNTTTNPGAQITAIRFTPANNQWTVSGLGTATASIVDTDSNTTGKDKSWNYTITATCGGQTYESDPKIVNKPDTSGNG